MTAKVSSRQLANTILKTALLAGLTLSAGFAVAAQQPISNDKQVNAARKTAKTPEDQRRIANYYREKAGTLLKKEKEERELANYYATHPSMYGKVYPNPYDNHKWRADSYQREANELLKKAQIYQERAGNGGTDAR